MPHDFGEPLAHLLPTIREAFSNGFHGLDDCFSSPICWCESGLVAGRAWQDDKRDFELAHWVRANDMCVSGRYGRSE